MRWVALSLVLFNVGYFAWGMFQQSRMSYHTQVDSALPREEAGRRLELLSERRQAQPFRQSVIAESSPPAPVSDGDAQCLFLGPFTSADQADQLQQRLFAIGVSSREKADQNDQQSDYWVHIPPLPSRDAAIRQLRELQAQKIDSFVITQGELANGISLGLFGHKESAENVSRRLMEAGYPVAIKSLPKAPEKWWLELNNEEEGKLNERFWGEVAH
ncbi:MAG: SPOR domain-containing protein, partial [Endozoicomonas sp.]